MQEVRQMVGKRTGGATGSGRPKGGDDLCMEMSEAECTGSGGNAVEGGRSGEVVDPRGSREIAVIGGATTALGALHRAWTLYRDEGRGDFYSWLATAPERRILGLGKPCFIPEGSASQGDKKTSTADKN